MVDVPNPILRFRKRGNVSPVQWICNATGLTLRLLRGLSPTLSIASVPSFHSGQVWRRGNRGASDVLAPYEFAIVAHWSGSPGSFAAQFGLSGYNTFPEVNWFWDTAMTLPDPASRGRSAGGTVGLLDFTDGVPTLLAVVNFGGSGITASNAYCATACSTAQSVQIDHFLTSPSGAFDAGEWAAATITGMGTIGIGSFVLDHSFARGLGMREIAKDINAHKEAILDVEFQLLSDITGEDGGGITTLSKKAPKSFQPQLREFTERNVKPTLNRRRMAISNRK